jgi:hypothetical protein
MNKAQFPRPNASPNIDQTKLRKCRICRHLYLPEAHNHHCPICGTVAIRLVNVTVKIKSEGAEPVSIGKAQFYGRGK